MLGTERFTAVVITLLIPEPVRKVPRLEVLFRASGGGVVDLALCVTRSSGLLEADVEAATDVRRVGVPVQSGEVLVGEGELLSQTVSAPLSANSRRITGCLAENKGATERAFLLMFLFAVGSSPWL